MKKENEILKNITNIEQELLESNNDETLDKLNQEKQKLNKINEEKIKGLLKEHKIFCYLRKEAC